MKNMLKQFNKVRPLFQKGGKFERLYPLFEAQDTFMFVPDDVTKGRTHIRDAVDLKRTMIMVVVALLPCILFGFWNTGHQSNVARGAADAGLMSDLLLGLRYVMPIILVSYLVGGVWEVLFAIVRKHEINEGFLVTGILFPLTLPPTIPLWMVAVGISFGVVIGKEVFGGTGFNVLNPALTARAFLFFAYPVSMSGDKVWTVTTDQLVEGFSGATPLGVAALAPVGSNVTAYLAEAGFTFKTMLTGAMGSSIGESCFIAVALGALILLISGVGSWRIMASGVLGLFLGSLALNSLPAASYAAYTQLPFHYHLVMGGFAFGLVFMATDPVSAAASNTGKLIYGFLIGFLVVLIRVVNPAYPEGVMLAILFMNVMAPMIDHYVVQHHIKQRAKRAKGLAHA